MTTLAVFLTIPLAAATAAEVLLPAAERLPLPIAPEAIRVEPLESRVVLEAPRSSARLAAALRRRRSEICPRVEEAEGEVRLRCLTTRLEASLARREGAATLELRAPDALPAEGELAMPILPYDLAALGLGECPGTSPTVRGECLLGQGDRSAARLAFSEALAAGAHGLAPLRLGDLALAEGKAVSAAAHWQMVIEPPWIYLAAARACERSRCAVGPAAALAFAVNDLPPPLALEMTARAGRALAFAGRPADALATLRARAGLCDALPALCAHVLLATLCGPPPGSGAALAIYLGLPDRERLPLAVELAASAAEAAAVAGAPAFGAALLGAAAGAVPERRLPAHLLRTAELYAAAGDGVRAGVVMDFARAHLDRGHRAILGSKRWKALAAKVSSQARAGDQATPGGAAPAQPAGDPPPDPDLDLARAAVQRAQSLPAGGRP